ncbi:ssDNA-binding protein [Roseibium sediminis]|uniref:ssDNA-binding protein n=1 Tax=Roseibium sediminis TaxID=1775174 RepID=UPI00123CFDEB|nr:ssDNA-binding protein [Roseibium sediminis]
MAFKPSFDPKTGRVKVLVRLSYFNGFRKSASVEGGSLKYRTNGLLYKDSPDGKASIKVVQQAIRHIISENWPGKDEVKFFKALKDRSGFFDGDNYTNEDGDVREHYEGTRYLKLTNDKKPKYRDRRGDEVDEEELEELFVSGYWAVAYFHFYPVKDKAKGGNGIFATLDALQFYKKDEQFAGGGIDDDEIEDLGDDEDDFDGDEDDGDDDEDERPRRSSKKPSRRQDDDDDDEDI